MGKARINFEDVDGRVACQIQYDDDFQKDSDAHQMCLAAHKFLDELFDRAGDPELVKYFVEGKPEIQAPPEKEVLLAPSPVGRHLRSC